MNDTNTLPDPQCTRRPCRSCGAPFVPARIHHRLCGDCWHWNKALSGIEAARLALREIRPMMDVKHVARG